MQVEYNIQGKHPASDSMMGYLIKNYNEELFNNKIDSIVIRNFGKQGSNDAMMAAFIEDLCYISSSFNIRIEIRTN